MWRAFLTSLVVAFVLLPVMADRGATPRLVTGTVAEFHAGESLLITGEMMDPGGLQFALRETTVFEGQNQRSAAAAIKPGVRVTVWYRSVAERHPVANKVRVLTAPAGR